jgi:hypothetical protein
MVVYWCGEQTASDIMGEQDEDKVRGEGSQGVHCFSL